MEEGANPCVHKMIGVYEVTYTADHLLLDRSLNIGPLISRWEPDKFKNC